MTTGRAGLCAAALLWAGAAQAAPLEVSNLRYLCDRGVALPVVFVTGPEDAVAVLQVDGSQILLYREASASGVRYAWPSDGAGYVLWTSGDEARVFWREAGAETPLLTCRAGG